MKIALTENEAAFAGVPADKRHWKMLKDTEGPDFSCSVLGIEVRADGTYFLMIPDREIPSDVFFSRVEQYEVIDSSVPSEWNCDAQTIADALSGVGKVNRFLGFPIFASTEDFVFRLSEEDLTHEEMEQVVAAIDDLPSSK
ncbi:hypothetical protein [Tateyamaria sp. SN3-11]|uniref:hypothetical protein n=1 Tax=Tateyamaria sp. SN3-11 TaxID=3092147 RepID=UPI0039E95EAB